MSETTPPPHTNGNGNQTTVVQAGIKLGTAVVTSLAPQFLALIMLNVVMLGLLYWFVDSRARHTAEILQQLLVSCLKGP